MKVHPVKHIHPAVIKIRFRVSLTLALLAILVIAGPADAMFTPSAPHPETAPLLDRAADMANIQKALESKSLKQRLVDYGLSPEGALAKINGLSDEQVHLLATNIDALQAGGMKSSDIIIILLLIIVVVLII